MISLHSEQQTTEDTCGHFHRSCQIQHKVVRHRIVVAVSGAATKEGAGSRVGFSLNGVDIVVHRPHPQKDTDKGAVKSVRKFLINAGVRP